MKKRFTLFICILAVCALLAGCGGSSSAAKEASSGGKSESSSPIEIKDILTQHEAYHTASGDGWDEYTTVFFGNDTKTLKALFIETRFEKSAGYTKEDLEALDIDTVYEGFSGFAFADYKIEESEDALNYVVRFRKLDDVENCKQMHNAGLLTLDQTTGIAAVDAQTIMDDLEKNGYEKVQMIDYGKLNLHFNLD